MVESHVIERLPTSTVIRTGTNGQRLTIPNQLPVLPIRNIVVFPGTVMPLNVGRQPFYVGVAENPAGGGAKNLITCIDLENSGVGEGEGEALFDASAVETPYLRHKLAQ